MSETEIPIAFRSGTRPSIVGPVDELRIERDGFELAASYWPAGDNAIVALDRRGEGESTGDVSRGRFEEQVEDVLAVIDAVDADRVGLWGISQGGWIGPLAAAASDDVAFLVLVASTGVTPSDQMMYAVEKQLRLAGFGDDAVDKALELRRRFEDWIHTRAPEPDEALAADLLAALDEPWAGQLWLPPSLLDEEGTRLWIEEMDFDPRPSFAQVRVPTLLFYGEADSWTPVEPSVDAWREARGDQVEIVVVPEAEHDMTLADGTLAPEYTNKLVDWLNREAA